MLDALKWPCIERDEFVRAGVACEKLFGGGNRGAAICIQAAMTAVVEHDVAGAAAALVAIDLLEQILGNPVCGEFAPVCGHRIPRDGNEAELAGEFKHIGATSTKRRTEVADGLARDCRENVAGAGEFVEDIGGSGAGQVWMRPGMIADEVAGIGDAASEFRLGLSEFADHEECGAHVVCGKNVEEARRPRRIGAVIEGECEFAGIARGHESAAEKLGGGPMRGIGEGADAQPGCPGDTDSPVNTRCQRRKHCC